MRTTAIEIAIATLTVIALAGCNRETSSAPSGGPAAATKPAAAPPTIAAAPAAPRADLGEDELGVIADVDPDNGEAPLKVKFSVEIAVDEEIPNAKYTWDFGDGTPSVQEQSPEHTYQKPGQYLATVRVAGGQGHHGWDECEIEVQPHELPAGEQ